MDYLKRAKELSEQLIKDRRHIHSHAETGMNLPYTTEYVFNRLSEMGYSPTKPKKGGIVALVGNPKGKTILLRADMDALPMTEENDLDFKSINTNTAHTCGHDMHSAMLLTAAKMLKENEKNLAGTVKLMFQPGEEVFEGARAMIEDGLLENPKVDAALAYHVGAGNMPIGIHLYNNKDALLYSNTGFKIKITGKGGHGAYPHFSVDPINIAVHTYLALQELIAREADPAAKCVLTIGKFNSGQANNAIPETAELEGTLRTVSTELKNQLTTRLKELSTDIAKAYRGRAEVEITSDVPPLLCNTAFTDEILKYMKQVNVPNQNAIGDIQASASEDFALILEKVPGTYMFLSAGFTDRQTYQAHNPKVIFNEDVLPIGAAYLAHCATEWLKNN
ncbi:amidohydrolase [Treponema denticola]|uniref:M20 family metallopeptidase n=1 Tax=Treponema denticola TaxID=158 RepID=UPI0021F87E26|nr:M20 family metallopeptidase [Treponema denticola]UYT07760.1 M20 family metallopeptidase [Treponema denticola]